MYRSYLSYRHAVPEQQIIDVRYDQLTNDPIGTLRQIYDHLSLGDITPALDSFPEYLAPRKSYVTNRHELSRYWQDQIRSEWSEYFETFGYADEAE
jgi:omega-hydroxy-beta-dihydromenaquinone-9 sulfotransferase